MVAAMTEITLHICADGSYIKEKKQGSHAWVFANDQRRILWKESGPSLGLPAVMSPYRAEQSGLTSALFLILWVCHTYNVETGNVIIYCDNISALNRIFTKERPSNNPLRQLAADIDLITCARDMILRLPVAIHISKEWVKGHYTGKEKQLKHILNDMADQLAVDHNTYQRQAGIKFFPSPLSEVKLLHNGMPITSRYAQVIKDARHTDALKSSIFKQTGWTPHAFSKVDFTAHKAAFVSHNRTFRICVCKLIHGLYQTKLKDHQFYGTSPTCPCCQSVDESLHHMLSCPSDAATEHRHCAMLTLKEALGKIGTPPNITYSITYGILCWTNSQDRPNQQIRAPTRGSVMVADVLLTQAFTEQTIDIGWDQFLRGRVSLMWSKAFSAYKSLGNTRNVDSLSWSKQLILKVWECTTSLWKFRNGMVHGTTTKENNEKVLAELRQRVSDKYAEYARDSFIISPRFNSLFLKKTLEDRIKMSRDSLSAWLRSVKEAEVYQGVFCASLAKAAKCFFRSKSAPQATGGHHNTPSTVINSVASCNEIVALDSCDADSVLTSSVHDFKTADFDPG